MHRCVGSNVARTVFKSMLTAVLDRMPDYVCDPAGTRHYETIGVIQGMKHLPADVHAGQAARTRFGRDAGEAAAASATSRVAGPAHHRSTRTRSSSTGRGS